MRQNNNFHEFGQELVEFALILPVLFLILIGIFDLGRFVYYYSALTNVAREGARAGIIYPVSNTKIRTAVCQLAIGIDLGCPNPPMESLVISLLDTDSDGDSDQIQVLLSLKYAPITPLIGSFFDLDENNQITVSSQATMEIEN